MAEPGLTLTGSERGLVEAALVEAEANMTTAAAEALSEAAELWHSDDEEGYQLAKARAGVAVRQRRAVRDLLGRVRGME